MTDKTEDTEESKVTPPAAALGPLVPRPVVIIIALGILALLGWHIIYDAAHADYENWKVTMLLGGLVFVVLGADVSKWLRGGSG